MQACIGAKLKIFAFTRGAPIIRSDIGLVFAYLFLHIGNMCNRVVPIPLFRENRCLIYFYPVLPIVNQYPIVGLYGIIILVLETSHQSAITL